MVANDLVTFASL